MANINIQRRTEVPPVQQPLIAREPFRWFRDLFKWDPFLEMAPVWPEPRVMEFIPAFEVRETPEAFYFVADLPGVVEKDLEITLTQNRLTVAGKRELEKEVTEEKYYVYERAYGTFQRIFTLPEGVDLEHIVADLKLGVLTLVVPKKPEALPRKILIQPKMGA